MDRFNSVAVREGGLFKNGPASGDSAIRDSSVEFLLGARVDSDWVFRKARTKFNADVMKKLKKAIYSIGQGGRRWFSGGGEVSVSQASTLLDYSILVELLLKHRDDLGDWRDDLLDCREQLRLYFHRYTEGQPERVVSLVEALVEQLKHQLADEQRKSKPR